MVWWSGGLGRCFSISAIENRSTLVKDMEQLFFSFLLFLNGNWMTLATSIENLNISSLFKKLWPKTFGSKTLLLVGS